MSRFQEAEYLEKHLAMQLHETVPPRRCAEMIADYEVSPEAAMEEIVGECGKQVFAGEIHALLEAYYGPGGYAALWPRMDVLDASASAYYPSTTWHLDGGPKKALKLFVYLNGVEEHGGNTLIIDRERTQRLRTAGALPLALDERTEELTPVLEGLGLDTGTLGFDLKAGDALLFDPFVLAHRCLPPKPGRKRYTVCFTIVPGDVGKAIRASGSC